MTCWIRCVRSEKIAALLIFSLYHQNGGKYCRDIHGISYPQEKSGMTCSLTKKTEKEWAELPKDSLKINRLKNF